MNPTQRAAVQQELDAAISDVVLTPLEHALTQWLADHLSLTSPLSQTPLSDTRPESKP